MSVIRHDGREWRIEDSAEGIPLVYGDGKYPHDPPRVASALEDALAKQLRGAVKAIGGALEELAELRDTEGLSTAQRALLGSAVALLTPHGGQ